uniref:Uncharacterized protein n=1 Tax=viral metagenome TaxID=1070528 RepID=A0A2V0RA58_9ZZZZ
MTNLTHPDHELSAHINVEHYQAHEEEMRMLRRKEEASRKLSTKVTDDSITTIFDGTVVMNDGSEVRVQGTKLLLSGSLHFILVSGKTQPIHSRFIREILIHL